MPPRPTRVPASVRKDVARLVELDLLVRLRLPDGTWGYFPTDAAQAKADWDTLSPAAQRMYLTHYCGGCLLVNTRCKCPGRTKQ